jgi:hypothetical protein
MFSDYLTLKDVKSSQIDGRKEVYWKETKLVINKTHQKLISEHEEEMARLSDRALLLLSFKDTPIQNLQTVLHILGIRTVEDKKRVLCEIFRLIREGIVYIPKWLPQLVESGLDYEKIDEIDLCLLQPFDHLIEEIHHQILTVQTELDNFNQDF